MLEDGIEYLGSRNGTSPRLNLASSMHPVSLDNQRLATGVILHVQESGEQPACELTFRQSETTSVSIGRKPGPDSDQTGESTTEVGKALLRCPVISRKHAKIAFSDSGHIYLIDLKSHHGTFLLKSDEATSKMLTPENPTIISDGDVITFGKAVGTKDSMVNPVTARVELLHEGQSKQTLTRTGSGRYGVYIPSAASSEAGRDSDIEEIHAPPLANPRESNSSSSSLSQALNVLKQLMPPMHPPSNTFTSDAVDEANPTFDPFRFVTLLSPISDPPISNPFDEYSGGEGDESDMDLLTPPYSPRSPGFSPRSPGFSPRSPGFSPCSLRYSPASYSPASPRSPKFVDFRSPSPYEPSLCTRRPSLDFEIFNEDRPHPNNELLVLRRSRSNSLMSLASHSPSPVLPPNLPPWRSSFRQTLAGPSESQVKVTQTSTEVQPDTEPAVVTPEVVPTIQVESPPSQSQAPEETSGDSIGNGADVENAIVESTNVVEEKENSEVDHRDEPSFSEIQDEIAKLKSARRKLKSRLVLNVNSMTDRMDDLEDRVSQSAYDTAEAEDRLLEVSQLSAIVDDQVNELTSTTIPSINARIELLNEEVKSMVTRHLTSEGPNSKETSKQSVDAGAEEITKLVQEMKLLYESAQKQMDVEVEAVKAARIAATAAIASQMQRTPSPSPKRKRAAVEEQEESSRSQLAESACGKPCGNFSPLEGKGHVDARPTKRRRRVLRAVAQTATAVTIGAVVTWGALAFS